MIRKWACLAAAALAGGLLNGCTIDRHQGDVGNKNIRPNVVVREDANGNRILTKRFANDQDNEMNRINGRRLNSNNLVGVHKNYRLEMSPDIAERISQLSGVGTAFVMLTDRNAYVAVTREADGDTAGIRGLSGISRTNLGHAGDPSRAPAGGGYGRGWSFVGDASSVPGSAAGMAGAAGSAGMGANGAGNPAGMAGAAGSPGTGANGAGNPAVMAGTAGSAGTGASGAGNVAGMAGAAGNAAGMTGMAGIAGTPPMQIDPYTGRAVPPGAAGTIVGTGYGDRYSGAGGTGISPNNTQGTGTHGPDGTLGTGAKNGNSGSGSDVNPNGSTLAGGGGTYGTSGGPAGGNFGMQSSRTGARGGDLAEPPAELENGTLEERIAAEVLRLAPDIERIYVSDAPDFTERMSSYALDVRDGQPIQSYIVEFNAMVDRVFPAGSGLEARAGRTGMR